MPYSLSTYPSYFFSNNPDASYRRTSLAYLLSCNSVLKYVLPLSTLPISSKNLRLLLFTLEVVYEFAANEIMTGIISHGIFVQTKVTTPIATIKFVIIFDKDVIRPFTCPVSFKALSAFFIISKTSVSSVFLNFILIQLIHKSVFKILSNFSQILEIFSPIYFLMLEKIKLPPQINAIQNATHPIFLLDVSAISSIKYCEPIIEIKG